MSDFVPRVVYESKPFESIAEFEIKKFKEIKFEQQILSKILMPGLNVECDLSFLIHQEVTNPQYNYTEETIKVHASMKGFDEAIWNSTNHQLQVTAKSSRRSITFADSGLISLNRKDFHGVLNGSVNYSSVNYNVLLPNGSLVVVISVKIFSKTGHIKTPGMNFDRNEVAKMNFMMLETGSFSDFKFLVEDKELKHEFKVHRSILATNSPVFEKMFSADMAESSSGQCVINDIKPEIFKHMLDFIYARKIPEDICDVAKDLYEAAHYYEIEKLKEICKEELPSKLSAKNAVEMYKFAWIYEINELKIEAWKIIKRDIIKDNNLGDDKMLSVELIDEILQYKKKMDELLKKASE